MVNKFGRMAMLELIEHSVFHSLFTVWLGMKVGTLVWEHKDISVWAKTEVCSEFAKHVVR